MKNIHFTILALLSILIGLSSCGGFKLSVSEQAAIDTVVARYEIKSYGWKKFKGFKNSTSQNRFSLELTGCPLAARFPATKKDLVAAIALTVYEHLGDSKKDYDLIEVRLTEGNEYVEGKFKTEGLDAFLPLLVLHHKTIAQFASGDVEGVHSNSEMNDTTLEEMGIELLREISQSVDSAAGPFHENCLVDYGYTEVDGQTEKFPVLKSMLKGTRRNLHFRQVFHPTTGKTVGIWFKEPVAEGSGS